MDESVFQQPTYEQLQQFVHGDPLALDDVLGIVLPQLYSWAERRYPQISKYKRDSVIHDVINETCQHYSRYDPDRAKFTTYVIDLIMKRMVTAQRQQMRLMQQEESLENLSENSVEATYNDVEADIVRRIDREEFFRGARGQLSQLEAAFWDLMYAGEIHQQPFLAVLNRAGITTNVNNQVKNTKERVKYKLATFAQVQGLRLEDFL